MLKAPFPYFGGKAPVAPLVWEALGDVRHYIEPFCGSCAVLLNRPGHDPARHVETVNDKSGYIANVWRAIQSHPEETARWCDWPVNHADLSARKKYIIEHKPDLLEHLIDDHEWCDPRVAGYWIWAASCWIGAGLTRPGQIPDVSRSGKGVHAVGRRPDVGMSGTGVHSLGSRDPQSEAGAGPGEPYNTNIYNWFRELSARLRYVRVVCGDWNRVCGGNWQDNIGTVGMFFDPPYGVKANRDPSIYGEDDSLTVADDVREWCLKRGSKKSYRIILAGYYEEHDTLLDHGWTVRRWKAQGGYSNLGKGKNENPNRQREALFMSPHCSGGDGGGLLGLME